MFRKSHPSRSRCGAMSACQLLLTRLLTRAAMAAAAAECAWRSARRLRPTGGGGFRAIRHGAPRHPCPDRPSATTSATAHRHRHRTPPSPRASLAALVPAPPQLLASAVWVGGVYTSGYVAPVAAVAAPVAPIASRCTCLTKEYTPEGAVLFKDVCTNEAAINPPAPVQQQSGLAPSYPQQSYPSRAILRRCAKLTTTATNQLDPGARAGVLFFAALSDSAPRARSSARSASVHITRCLVCAGMWM